ncbi:pirin family protein [Lutimonas zeaxanthinifaciens]|uniref:pirin family protein n=1 Tax=Lutimonas zeaxanthinifaciens TaxID=3060215 RepID=UPI00265D362F|nr:pirin-like C-terminal cupin domain-containing protein [Lutimonas sp. YSD2104]WKK66435.1 pirin-like C-terminal cupin domain-containing protein [Lutimonas sp. YSD2104]
MDTNKIIQVKPLGFPWETQDPFLFCAYHRDEYPEGDDRMGLDREKLAGRNIGQDFVVKDGFRMYHGSHIPGFPYHPHRGFETITINKEGFVDHTDSLGAAGRFGKGDVQWMTAGKGIQHSEMFPMLEENKGNPLEIFQVWLNLPKASKFVEPHFRMLWKDMVPEVTHTENGKTTTVNVIAGELNEVKAPGPTPDSWAANPDHGVAVFTIKMEAGATWKLPSAAKQDVNRTLYFYKGESVDIEGQKIAGNHLIQVNPNEDIVLTNGNKDGYFLLLQGKPINEPVAQYGPFVMNTEAEIQEAFSDYKRTQFGGWPWPDQEQVHDRDKGRFALHADGREELKS